MPFTGNTDNALRRLRKSKQWSISALARELHISRVHYQQMETGRRKFQEKHILGLAQILNADEEIIREAINDIDDQSFLQTSWLGLMKIDKHTFPHMFIKKHKKEQSELRGRKREVHEKEFIDMVTFTASLYLKQAIGQELRNQKKLAEYLAKNISMKIIWEKKDEPRYDNSQQTTRRK